MALGADDVLTFWFKQLDKKQWFKKDASVDADIRSRFEPVYWQAGRGEHSHWREDDRGRLAEIIVLDQFSRNMFRDQAQAFAFDPLAVVLSQEAIRAGADQSLTADEKAFLYMPLMHSESPVVHQQALAVFDQPGLEENLRFEKAHWRIIERFGRYPHRNEVLGRESTEEELEFLKQPGSSF